MRAMAVGEPLAPMPRWRRAAPLALAAALLALILGGGIAAFTLSRPATSDAPSSPGAFAIPPPASPVARFDVREASGGALTLAPASHEGAPLTATLRADAAVEALLPLAPAAVAPGHWITVIGEPDPVRNFVIRRIVVLPAPSAPAADGLARSPAGFTGAELTADPAWRPLLWGPVVSVAPAPDAGEGAVEAALAGPDGPVTLLLAPRAPLYAVEPWPAPVAEGDQLAIRAPADADPADARAILVAPSAANPAAR